MKKYIIITLFLASLASAFAASITFPTNYIIWESYDTNQGTIGVITVKYYLKYDETDTNEQKGRPFEITLLAKECESEKYDIYPQNVTDQHGNKDFVEMANDNLKIVKWHVQHGEIDPSLSYKIKVMASDTAIMTYVIGGEYQMGRSYTIEGLSNTQDDELPVHKVKLDHFFISAYQVTQGDFELIMGYNPSTEAGQAQWGEGKNYPVHGVNWYETIAYSNKRSFAEGFDPVYTIDGSTDPEDWGKIPTSTLAGGMPTGWTDTNEWETARTKWDAVEADFTKNGYRLPTEAEWEYAARGAIYFNVINKLFSGPNQKDNAGNDTGYGPDIDEVAWYQGNTTHEVGLKDMNPIHPPEAAEIGTYDMSGNVSEWCWDWYDPVYYEEGGYTQVNGEYPDAYAEDAPLIENPKGPATGTKRVRRGGTFADHAYFCRVFYRDQSSPIPDLDGGWQRKGIGFRVVRTCPPCNAE